MTKTTYVENYNHLERVLTNRTLSQAYNYCRKNSIVPRFQVDYALGSDGFYDIFLTLYNDKTGEVYTNFKINETGILSPMAAVNMSRELNKIVA